MNTEDTANNNIADQFPCITPEQYKELIIERQKVLVYKAQKSDYYDYVTSLEASVKDTMAQIEELNKKINESSELLQSRVKELIEPHGIQGEFTISEEEPHYIIPKSFSE